MDWKNVPDSWYSDKLNKSCPEYNNLLLPEYSEIMSKISSICINLTLVIAAINRETGSDLISEIYKHDFPTEFMKIYKNVIYRIIELNEERDRMIKLQDLSK